MCLRALLRRACRHGATTPRGQGRTALGHDALDGLASRNAGAPTHRAPAAVRLDRSPSMATLAPRPRLLLALRRPQPRRLSARAAAPCARRAPVSPQAARPRRVFLGLGATVIDQVARMASGGTSSRSFVAGARPRQGVSPVEQVLRRWRSLLCFVFLLFLFENIAII